MTPGPRADDDRPPEPHPRPDLRDGRHSYAPRTDADKAARFVRRP